MTMSVPERKSGSEGKEEESEDESEILEESPCGRWQKRKEQPFSGFPPGLPCLPLYSIHLPTNFPSFTVPAEGKHSLRMVLQRPCFFFTFFHKG
ncbi:hypothetical protein AMECASPLE_021707 [Ameca splendens]|uniref:Uncharacterized protein n=1 Tax=Ameca splendens TaxID=208324 RepID=A0ABV0XGM0_9TELE